MRLRRSNSLQASKLAYSLRNSALRSKVRSPLHVWESPEIVTNRGKSSSVSERSIHKLSDNNTFLDERGNSETYASNKRLTRATDEEGKGHFTMYRVVDEHGRTRRESTRKLHWRGKAGFVAGRKAGTGRRIPEPLDSKQRENCEDLGLKENLALESQLSKPSGASADRSLTRLDTAKKKHSFENKASNISNEQDATAYCSLNQNPKKLRQARAVLMTLVQQKRLPLGLISQGVTTRQKANSTAEDQSMPEMWEQKQSRESYKRKKVVNEVAENDSAFAATKGNGAVSETEVSIPLRRQTGLLEEFQARKLIGHPRKIPFGNPEGRLKKLQKEANQISVRRSKRKSIMEDLKQINQAMHRPEDLTPQRLESSFETHRQSKRKRTINGGPSQHEAITKGLLLENSFPSRSKQHSLDNSTTALQVRGQTKSEEVEKAAKVRQDEMGPGSEVLKIDALGKSCLVATNPAETGGRQMRPRPLDLEQPLLVLVDGRDQDYYDLDGGSFHQMLQQQSEWNVSSFRKLRSNSTSRKTPVNAKGEKAGSISVPSFRCNIGSENSFEGLYVLSDSYIRTSSEDRICHQIEYDMDDEDEAWLAKYNQSLSPKSKVSADQFEKIVELLENRANGEVRANPITQAVDHIEEQVSDECCICNGGENSATNLVYQCSGCNILVHQSCYGIQGGSRSGQRRKKWKCRKCEAVVEGREDGNARCSLCCKQGGALKPTTEPHGWAHVVCALYTNETYFVNPDAMEPIDGVEAADARARRQKRQCWLCRMREGSVERCSVPACKALLHVSCGVSQGASFVLQHSNNQVTSVRVYCPQHELENARATLEEKQGMEEESLSHSSWRRGQRRSPRKGRFYFSGQIGEHAETSASKGCMTGNCTEKSIEAEGNLDRASAETAHAALTVDDMREVGPTSPGLMEGIYLYWVSKRAKEGGALLHHILQEHAAKQFGIFNSDSDDDASGRIRSSSHWSFPMRQNETDMKVLEARQQLQRLQELTFLIVQRERLKLEMFTLDQDIFREGLKARNAGQRPCSLCKEIQLCLVCTACNRSTCCLCLQNQGSSRPTKWLNSLRLTCVDCESQGSHTQSGIACKPRGTNYSVASGAKGTSRQHKRAPKKSRVSSHQRSLILLPRSDAIHQDRFAMEAFWEQKPNKIALVSDLHTRTDEMCGHVRRYC